MNPPAAVIAERAALSAATITTAACDHVLDAITEDDLTRPDLRLLFQALRNVRLEGRDIDAPAVASALVRLGQPPEQAQQLVAAAAQHVPLISEIPATIREVQDAAIMRRRHHAALELARAAATLDQQAWDQAERRLHETDRAQTVQWVDGQHQAERFAQRLQAGDSPRIPTGMPSLDRVTGGLRPGQLTIVLGVTSHGKSALIDTIAAAAADAGYRTGLAINEQTIEERYERAVARESRVPLYVIDEAQTGRGRLRDTQAERITHAAGRLANLPLAWLPATGMTAGDLARHARRQRLDLLVVDGLQGLPPQPGRKPHEYLQDAVHELDEHAKRTGCHVLIAAHVNRQRLKNDGTWPMPGLGDVADCTGATKRADNVLCVWREQDRDTLDPLDEGLLRMAKWRGAALQSFPVLFDGARMRWTETQ